MDIVFSAGEIAREAGRLVAKLSLKRDLVIEEKGSSADFVTEADTSSQNLIKQRVGEMYPGDRVVGEEDGLSDAEIMRRIRTSAPGERFWLVDPLDGTINYIRGMLGYGISIAVFEGGVPVAGAVYQPDVDALYLGQRGGGATLNGRPIHVAEHTRLCDAIGSTHIPVSDKNWRAHTNIWNEAVCRECQNLRMLGASVYEQTRVAAGGLDFYYEIGPHPWDLAAGCLIVEEAGGIVTRLDGGAFDYGWGGVLIASRAIHPEALRLLNEADPRMSDLR